ncbi:AraC family transcriptional regulator [Actinomadura terrae]|uniref:AraC family transcriptional regulator n=1 Tax=Actinomadura terrae TaxID=604353 RepID=UPI001FA81598|nr:AraC family transcriptional regulator [Actinomadura terrae]
MTETETIQSERTRRVPDLPERESERPPLSAYQRVSGETEIDVLHDEVEPFAVGHDLQLLKRGIPLDGRVNALGVGAVNLVWVRYGGGGVIVDTPPTGGEFAMCAPIAPMDFEYRTTKEHGTAGGSLVLSHDKPMRMKPDPRLGCLVIATSTGRLTDYLADYLGDQPGRPLRFHGAEPGSDARALAPASIVEQTWRHVCRVLDNGSHLHPLAARNLEEALLTAILLGLPHTATASLAEPPRRVPHYLATLIRDWVHAHYNEPIGVRDVAAAAGIGIRQLQVICRDQWGVTPTQLLRGVRLDNARAAILAAHSAPGVITRIAESAGYMDLTRFGVHYRRRFGETPTQTLNHSRPASRLTVAACGK